MTESWENLVLPVLRLAKSHKVTDLHRLIHAVKAQRGEREPDPNTPLSGMVGSAFAALLHSELLVVEEGNKFKVSTAGLKILENPPARLDLSYLKTIPQYVAYSENLRRDQQARGFQRRRFEYYASGRRLFFHEAWQPALTLLAYAIEYHLKSPLAGIEDCLQKGEQRQLRSGHSLSELHKLAVRYGFFRSCRISQDFLRYAGDMFNLRYPRGEMMVLDRRGGYRVSKYLIFTYDDCMMQLDQALSSDFGDPTLSMGVAASGGIPLVPTSAVLSESFFHCNPFALLKLNLFKEIIDEHDVKVRVDLPVSPEEGFAADSFPMQRYSLGRCAKLLEFRLAADFRIPKPREPDPDPAAAFLTATESHHHATRKVLSRLTEEFGNHRVTTKGSPSLGVDAL